MTFSIAPRAIVVDASAAVEFLLGRPVWVGHWRAWASEQATVLVPAHFKHEVANALLLGVRIGAEATVGAMERLFRVDFQDADRGLAGIAGATRLADRHGLTVYDAAYLELAIDVDGELATLDKALRAAAVKESVSVIG